MVQIDPSHCQAGCGSEEERSAFADVFCIPHDGDFIVYLPLRGLIMLGNAALVNALYKARLGDRSALADLDVDETLVNELFESGRQLENLCTPKTIPPFAPTSVTLFLTNDCTLRCRYCYADGGHDSTEMPLEAAQAILDQVAVNAVGAGKGEITVNFHGGGDVSAAWPLLLSTYDYLQSLLGKHGLTAYTSVGLNGVLDDEQRAWIARNIGGATVSIDGPPDIHDAHRPLVGGGGSYPIVHDTLKAFDEAGFPYAIRTTVSSFSVSRLEESIGHLCREFGAKRIKAEPMYPRGRGLRWEIGPPGEAEFVENYRRAKAVANDLGKELVYSGARLETLTNVFCQAAGHSCAITPEGWVTSCYEVISLDDPFADRFFYGRYDPDAQRLVVDEDRRRALFMCSVHNKPECAKCFCKWHCAGDCLVKALHSREAGAAAPLDRCYINRELTKDQLIAALG